MNDFSGNPARASAPRSRAKLVGVALACAMLGSGAALAQTTLGSSTSIVFPVVAATAAFTGQVTLFNPNGSDITVGIDYFDADNLSIPGAKPCADVVIPANRSMQFNLATQCTLGAGSHFGLLIASDNAGTNQFYGYQRTDNNAGAGFSIEGFPLLNFSGNTTNVTGLKSVAAAPTFQSNCFAASLADPVTYDLALFDDTTGAQIGTTVSGSLGAFAEFRYLDVFAAAGAAPGDYTNVRAQFTRTSAGTQNLIGFCTVQDNVSFGADFRIAKSPTPAPVPISSTPWGGAVPTIPSGTVTYIFAGPTATIVLPATATLNAYGSAAFARVSGPIVTPSVAVCYQDQSGPGPVTTMGTPTDISVSTTLVSFGQSGSATVPASTYSVGFCIQNNSPGSLNNNGTTSGFVIVTP
jgi:hypothetical protein